LYRPGIDFTISLNKARAAPAGSDEVVP